MQIALFIAFIIKHFICDFPLQIPYMYLNKGQYGHPGGLEHAACHATFTLLILSLLDLSPALAIGASGFDFIIHYHVDWFKTWWCDRKGYKCNNSSAYWIWLGIDQMVHYLTYAAIIWGVTQK